jgi:hypothetical protein
MNTVGRLSIGAMLTVGCGKEYDIIAMAPEVDPGAYMECPFSELDAGDSISVYTCNPVFDTTDETWGSSVGSVGFYTNLVLGHPIYQIWYGASIDGSDFLSDWGVGSAVSTNGTDWDPHPDNPLLSGVSGAWDEDGMAALQIVRDTSMDRYIMAYQGYTFDGSSWSIGVGVASSEDGISWDRSTANPVLMQGTPYNGDVYITWPFALYAGEGGGVTAYLGGGQLGSPVDMYAAQLSDDLSGWDIMEDPVIEAGPEMYDQLGISDASVVKVGDTYYMFYVGFSDWEPIEGGASVPLHTTLNLATSRSGISWEKHPSNPLPVHLTIKREVTAVAAQVLGGQIHLWVTDNYATGDEPTHNAVGYYLIDPEGL